MMSSAGSERTIFCVSKLTVMTRRRIGECQFLEVSARFAVGLRRVAIAFKDLGERGHEVAGNLTFYLPISYGTCATTRERTL